MRITLTGRRLALAAVLILGGVAAPLAYATIADTKTVVANAVPLGPVSAASPGSTQAPAAVADNPYQFFQQFTTAVGGASTCQVFALPAGQDFVLESVTFVTSEGVGTVSQSDLVLVYKTPSTQEARFAIPRESPNGTGTRTFNLVVRPDTLANAAVGDIYGLSYCAAWGAPVTFGWFLTGQKIGVPTAAQVSSFDATSGNAGATLNWRTASETEILGFNVWRYRGAKGVKVNRTLVRAKRSGEPAGASYRFVDYVRGAKRGLTYRLQLVDLKGKRTWYAAFAIASK